MRISNNNQNKEVDVGNVSRSRKSDKAKGSNDAKDAGSAMGVGDSSSVNISSEAKAVSSANKIARSNEADEAKIASIKAAINNGTYKPDFSQVADRMVNEQLMQELA
jgi:flagellar biosynthesis anti-sigma factor FlgM